LTGEGVVLPNEDQVEVDRRFAAFQAELAPSGEMGRTLVKRVATLAVRLDRCVAQETAALSARVRQAEAEFEAPEGFDPAEVERLRGEAGRRAMFDPSKEASLARKYEAAAERGMFRALKELRQVEKEVKASDPVINADNFQETLGSFLEFEKMVGEMEAMYPETAFSKPSEGVARGRDLAFGASFDVPFTIGRRR
jgi:hypothetical protein